MKSVIVKSLLVLLSLTSGQLALANRSINEDVNVSAAVDAQIDSEDLNAEANADVNVRDFFRPGFPPGPGHGPGPGFPPGHGGPGFPPGPGHGPGPGYPPSYGGVICYAQNLRGQIFEARGRDANRVQWRAMDTCQRYSYRCRPAGCRYFGF